jgi:dihydrodipicolinate synthase/N-acetylneuraminate lyase
MVAIKGQGSKMEGVFPLITFAVHKDGSADYEGLVSNVEFLVNSGVHGVMMFGCMGEFYAPTFEEYKQCVDLCVKAANKRVTVLVGATWQNTAGCIERAQYCEQAGVDAVMVAAPYVITPTAEVTLRHFTLLDAALKNTSILVYNYPPLTHGYNSTPEIWEKLMQLKHIKALKESNPETWHRIRVLNKIADKINVFSGGEALMLSDFILGAKGVISLFGIAIPKTVLKLYNSLVEKNYETAAKLIKVFAELNNYLTLENEVAALKASAEIFGRPAGSPREPYPALDKETYKGMEKYLKQLEKMA